MGPWVKVPEPVRSADHSNWIRDQGSMQANGFLYWVYDDRRHMVSLDTATMEISVFELPQCLLESYVKNVGETKGGATCIVYAEMLNVGVLMHTRDDDGVGGWVQDRAVTMATELERVLPGKFDEHSQMVRVWAVQDGYAYVATSADPFNMNALCWFMSLCLETMKLEKLFRMPNNVFDVHPYIMRWPRLLNS